MVRPTTIVALSLVLIGAALQYERVRWARRSTVSSVSGQMAQSRTPLPRTRATSRPGVGDDSAQPLPTSRPRRALTRGLRRLPLSPTENKTSAADALAAARAAANEPLVSEADARSALAEVGVDSDAEQLWATAINDPNLSPEDRSNLIEDLNETGLADPEHPTADDLPIIERRLEIIEALAPDAMDDTNAAAFEEAYKDLSNMYDSLQPR